MDLTEIKMKEKYAGNNEQGIISIFICVKNNNCWDKHVEINQKLFFKNIARSQYNIYLKNGIL